MSKKHESQFLYILFSTFLLPAFLFSNRVYADTCKQYFSASVQIQYYDIKSGLKIRTTSAKLEAAALRTERLTKYLIEAVINPDGIAITAAEAVMKPMKETTTRISQFIAIIANNRILNQNNGSFFTADSADHIISDSNPASTQKISGEKILQSSELISQSRDHLTSYLQELGTLGTPQGRFTRALSKIPGFGQRAGKQTNKHFEIIRQKIRAVDLSLATEVSDLQSNITALQELKVYCQQEAQTLAQEIIFLKMLADALKSEVLVLEVTDIFAARTVQSEVIPIVQRNLGIKMGLFGTLMGAQEGITEVVHLKLNIIEEAENLRYIVTPATHVSLMITATAIEAQKAVERHETIKRLVNSTISAIGRSIQEANALYYKVAGTPTIDPEVLKTLLETLDRERKLKQDRNIEIGNQLQRINDRMAEVFSTNLRALESDDVSSVAQQAVLELSHEAAENLRSEQD